MMQSKNTVRFLLMAKEQRGKGRNQKTGVIAKLGGIAATSIENKHAQYVSPKKRMCCGMHAPSMQHAVACTFRRHMRPDGGADLSGLARDTLWLVHGHIPPSADPRPPRQHRPLGMFHQRRIRLRPSAARVGWIRPSSVRAGICAAR